MADMTNGGGNCLPTHHEGSSRKGGFQRVEQNSYEEENDYSDNELDNNSEEALSLNELMYSAHSFHVMVAPVSITMILAALAVTYINTPQTLQEGAQELQVYHVWKVDIENDSTSKQLVADFVNGFVMVTVIGTMTFGIVLLYKYRCMKFLIGYMMFSSMTLLGVLGAVMFHVMIEKYQIPIDKLTFVFALYNFAFVGVAAIFYQLGIPPYITQGYLICSSVIVAWQLSHFDTISTWTLLIMLGLYDLCAVLTPCGPLRALVNLMSDEDAPEMPGLLYEAEIPEGLKRPVMGGRGAANNSNDEEESDADQSVQASVSADSYQQPSVSASESEDTEDAGVSNSDSGGDVEMSDRNNRNEEQQHSTHDEQLDGAHLGPAPTAKIPFGLAKLYRLKLTAPPPFVTSSRKRKSSLRNNVQPGNISTDPLLSPTNDAVESGSTSSNPSDDSGALDAPFVIDPDVEYTPKQFNTIVEAILPRNGAKIVRQPRHSMEAGKPTRYGVFGSDGELKRILFIRDGKAYEESMDDDDDSEDGRFSNTIKLGLGDFIFYSVLVAKSAQYSFTCFASSFLVILAGLGGTLVLLAVYKHALPALPISIFLAAAFYLLTRFCIEPWIHVLMTTPFYV
eukprot:scaffold44636_cov197-Skeletonema_marinoi.AAC.3